MYFELVKLQHSICTTRKKKKKKMFKANKANKNLHSLHVHLTGFHFQLFTKVLHSLHVHASWFPLSIIYKSLTQPTCTCIMVSSFNYLQKYYTANVYMHHGFHFQLFTKVLHSQHVHASWFPLSIIYKSITQPTCTCIMVSSFNYLQKSYTAYMYMHHGFHFQLFTKVLHSQHVHASWFPLSIIYKSLTQLTCTCIMVSSFNYLQKSYTAYMYMHHGFLFQLFTKVLHSLHVHPHGSHVNNYKQIVLGPLYGSSTIINVYIVWKGFLFLKIGWHSWRLGTNRSVCSCIPLVWWFSAILWNNQINGLYPTWDSMKAFSMILNLSVLRYLETRDKAWSFKLAFLHNVEICSSKYNLLS